MSIVEAASPCGSAPARSTSATTVWATRPPESLGGAIIIVIIVIIVMMIMITVIVVIMIIGANIKWKRIQN